MIEHSILFWCVFAAAAVVVAWNLMPGIIRYKHGTLRKYHLGRPETLKISELSKIEYSYHAVVGFIGVWSFVDVYGNNISVDSNSFGIKSVLHNLEKVLEGFSLDCFERQFEEGDVVDTLIVWENT